jgi:hypothetical protein
MRPPEQLEQRLQSAPVVARDRCARLKGARRRDGSEGLSFQFGGEVAHGPQVAIALRQWQDVRPAQLHAKADPFHESTRLLQPAGGKPVAVEPDQRAEIDRLG